MVLEAAKNWWFNYEFREYHRVTAIDSHQVMCDLTGYFQSLGRNELTGEINEKIKIFVDLSQIAEMKEPMRNYLDDCRKAATRYKGEMVLANVHENMLSQFDGFRIVENGKSEAAGQYRYFQRKIQQGEMSASDEVAYGSMGR